MCAYGGDDDARKLVHREVSLCAHNAIWQQWFAPSEGECQQQHAAVGIYIYIYICICIQYIHKSTQCMELQLSCCSGRACARARHQTATNQPGFDAMQCNGAGLWTQTTFAWPTERVPQRTKMLLTRHMR